MYQTREWTHLSKHSAREAQGGPGLGFDSQGMEACCATRNGRSRHVSTVGADLERLEEQAMIRLALAGLPPRCRRLLEALYYEDPAPAYA